MVALSLLHAHCGYLGNLQYFWQRPFLLVTRDIVSKGQRILSLADGGLITATACLLVRQIARVSASLGKREQTRNDFVTRFEDEVASSTSRVDVNIWSVIQLHSPYSWLYLMTTNLFTLLVIFPLQ